MVMCCSMLVTSHTGIFQNEALGWGTSYLIPGIPSAQTKYLSPLNFLSSILQGGPSPVYPGSWKGLEKTAQSPFGPNFGTGFFRTPTKAKVPKGDRVSVSTFLSTSEQFAQPPCHEPAARLILVTDDGN